MRTKLKPYTEVRQVMSDFRRGLLYTVVPIMIMSVAGMGMSDITFHPLWYVGVAFWGVGIFAALGFGVAGKKEIAKGISRGLIIGFVFLLATSLGVGFVSWG